MTGADKAASCSSPGSIVAVKNVKSGAREYVEFKFKQPDNETQTVSAPTGPFVGTSGNAVTVSGALFTLVNFNSVDWTCSIPINFAPKPILKGLKNFEQFEGNVQFAIGRKAGSHYLKTEKVSCGANLKCVRAWFGP